MFIFNICKKSNIFFVSLIFIVAVSLFLSCPANAQGLKTLRHFKNNPDGSQVLLNHLPDEVARGKAQRISSFNPSQEIELSIVLPSKDPLGLDNFIKNLYNPKSSIYHKFLTPKQFAQQFGASSVNSSLVIEQLKSQGLQVLKRSTSGYVLKVRGTARTIGSAFHVNINNYKQKDGTTFFSADSNPTLSTLLAGKIDAIVGLDNLKRFRPNFHARKFLIGSNIKKAASTISSYSNLNSTRNILPKKTIKSQGNSTPVAPTYLTAVATNQAVLLYWAASPGATSYNIYRSTTGGVNTFVKALPVYADGTSVIITTTNWGDGLFPDTTINSSCTPTSSDCPLTINQSYYYYVTAVGSGGEGVPSATVSATPFSFLGESGFVGPTDLVQGYSLGSLPSNASGSTQTLALFEMDGYTSSDITTFTGTYYPTYFGASYVPPLTPVCVDVTASNGLTAACPITGSTVPAIAEGTGEVALDIDLALAVTPKIGNIQVFETSNSANGWIDQWETLAGNQPANDGHTYQPSVISASWTSGPESYDSSTQLLNGYDHTVFSQLASQGQSVFIAAGDSGAYAPCDSGSNPPNCTISGIPAVLSASVFMEVFSAYSPITSLQATGILNWLVSQNYLNSAGSVIVDLSSSTSQTATNVQNNIISQYGNTDEAAIIYNVLLDAYAAAADNIAPPSVNDPVADPYVTAVGISTLRVNVNSSTGVSTGAYASEMASLYGGGGVSSYWPLSSSVSNPASYQYPVAASALSTNPASLISTSYRNVPDVSINGDPASSYGIYISDPQSGAGFYFVWGSSAAAPIWASFISRVNAGRVAQGSAPIGLINSTIYQIAQGSHYATDFNNNMLGINSSYSLLAGNDYYPAEPGFNDATGLGSFVGLNLYNDLLGGYSLTETVVPSGSGTITCGSISGTCPAAVDSGTQITFYGNSNPGFALSSWSVSGSSNTLGTDCASAVAGTCTVTVGSATIVTANFTSIPEALTVNFNSAQGTVTCNGIACTSPVNGGSSIVFQANPLSGYGLTGWTVSGSTPGSDCSGTSGTCTVTITGTTTVTASFIQIFPVTTIATPSNEGTVTCASASCPTSADAGAQITFTANPNPGYGLTGWNVSGGTGQSNCSGTTGTCTVTISIGTTVTANFVFIPETLTVNYNSAQGTVTCNSAACTSPVNGGSSIVFQATPLSGYLLTGWTVSGSTAGSDCATATAGTCTVTITGTTTVTASFVQVFSVTATPSNSNGTVTCNSGSCPSIVDAGTQVTFNANPTTGYEVSSWTVSAGDTVVSGCTANSTTCVVTVNNTTQVTANFIIIPVLSPTSLKSTILVARIGGHFIYGATVLTWAQSTTSGVIKNNVYRSSNSGPYVLYATLSPTTTFTDKNTQKGTTYHYEVTAYASGAESIMSNTATSGY